MFGKKKEITEKLLRKDEVELDDYGPDEIKKEKNKNTQPNNNTDNNFIFYGRDNKFTKQLEIYATLKSLKNEKEIENPKNKKLVLVVVDSNSPMKLLSYKICESFGQFPEYQNLEGLDAINLQKMDEEKKILPTEGNVGDFLRNGDIIYLELISNEIWIKTNLTMSNVINKNAKLNITMDIKIKRESIFQELRYKLLKCGIMCYLNKFSKTENNFHYIISEFTIFIPEQGIIEESKLKTVDIMKIKQLFGFKNNIKIQIKFYPVEFVLFQKLKAIPKPKKEKIYKKKLLWDKFKVSRFRDLLYNKKYIREKEYIFKYIKSLFKEKTLLSKCYVYSLDDDYNTEVTENTYEETKCDKIDEEKDLSILNINNEVDKSQDIIDIDNEQKKNTSLLLSKSSMLNRSNRSSRNSNVINTSNSFTEDNKFDNKSDNKYTLIVIPPHQYDEENENEISFRNKKYSTKNLDLRNSLINNNIDEEINEFEENIDNIESKKTQVFKPRRSSFYNSNIKKNLPYGTLDFEIIEKSNLLEKDDEIIIYKDLKPKAIVKNKKGLANALENQNKINLCYDFEIYFDKAKFTDFISGLNLMSIKKGALENCTIPQFRGFKDVKKKNRAKKRKKRKISTTGSSSYYGQIFPIKRMNFEIGIFSIFIFGILMYLSYLVSNTYY